MTFDSRKNKSNAMRAAVIGCPIQHSKSPLIQNYALKLHGISAHYTAMHVSSELELGHFFDQLRSREWAGVNVTIPYKEAVLPYLDRIHDNVQMIGACNTIVNKNGELIGYNTDAEGFDYPIKEKTISSVTILGNGGASKAVLFQCTQKGIQNISLVARRHDRSNELCDRLETAFNIQIKRFHFDSQEMNASMSADLIINSTSVGMNSQDKPFECVRRIGAGQIFYDLIYSPWETTMMKICKENGAEVVNGAMMLAHQGALAFELFFGKTADTLGMFQQLKESVIE